MNTPLLRSISDLSLNEYTIKENDWTFEHIRTLITWLNYSNVNMFLIDLSIKYYKSIISHIMAYTLLFSTVSSTISISQLGISSDTQPQLFAIVQYCFIGASTLSTLLIGYMKLFKVQESLDTNTLLYKSWLTFSTRISSEFQMPIHMRTSALELLQDMKNEYIDLFCKDANIPFAVKNAANNYFRRNLSTRIVKNEYSGSWCSYRTNYIKRTNVFFIFQDIIKNEIKRLSAELTPINYSNDNNLDNIVPSYYGDINNDTLKRNKLNPNVLIEYTYDGPFIIIDVKDRSESFTYVGKNQRMKMAGVAEKAVRIAKSNLDNYRTNMRSQVNEFVLEQSSSPTRPGFLSQSESDNNYENENKIINDAIALAISTTDTTTNSRKRKTLLSRFKRSNESEEELPPINRERQMSFSLPERSLVQQSYNNAHNNPHNKTYYDLASMKIQKAAMGAISLSTDEERNKVAKLVSTAKKAAHAGQKRAISIGGEVAAAVINHSDDLSGAHSADSAAHSSAHSAANSTGSVDSADLYSVNNELDTASIHSGDYSKNKLELYYP